MSIIVTTLSSNLYRTVMMGIEENSPVDLNKYKSPFNCSLIENPFPGSQASTHLTPSQTSSTRGYFSVYLSNLDETILLLLLFSSRVTSMPLISP